MDSLKVMSPVSPVIVSSKVLNFYMEVCKTNSKIDDAYEKELSFNKMDTVSKIEFEKDKYSYCGPRKYLGLEFIIEFCNSNFIPVTKMEKLYLDKLYLYADYHDLLSQYEKPVKNTDEEKMGTEKTDKSEEDDRIIIDDDRLLCYFIVNSVDKKQVAINFKKHLDLVVYLVKNNQYDEAINSVIDLAAVMTKQMNEKQKIKSKIKSKDAE